MSNVGSFSSQRPVSGQRSDCSGSTPVTGNGHGPPVVLRRAQGVNRRAILTKFGDNVGASSSRAGFRAGTSRATRRRIAIERASGTMQPQLAQVAAYAARRAGTSGHSGSLPQLRRESARSF